MPDPNPYESPQTDQPLKRSQIAKRSAGVGAILLLTPPAMVIAVATCCAAPKFLSGGGGLLVTIFGPFLALYGLMAWAAALDRPQKDDANQISRRGNFLLIIPLIMAGASVAGLAVAAIAAAVVWETQGAGLSDAGFHVGTIVLWTVTGATLLLLLFVAWRRG